MKTVIALQPQGDGSGPRWSMWLTPENPEEKIGLESFVRQMVTPRFVAAGFQHAGSDTVVISWPEK